MAITLKNTKTIPAIALDKLHIISYLQTEKMEKPYTITIEAKVILYGHDAEGNRVYDPDGPRIVKIPDFRVTWAEYISSLPPTLQIEQMKLNNAYIQAVTGIITVMDPAIGELEA